MITTLEDRSLLIKACLEGGKIFCANKKVLGFYLPKINEGQIVSIDLAAGIELLKLRLNEKSYAIIPMENEDAITFLKENNFNQFSTGARMRLGFPIKFNGNMIYSRIGGNLG